MKKAVILALFMALLAIPAFAQDEYEELPREIAVPETVQNRLSIEFHAVSGDDKVTLSLPDYFGRKADFVVARTEHVNVVIDSNGVATLSAKDPNWRGIEEIVFAVSEEYLAEKERKKIFAPRVRNLTLITSKDQIALISDAFTQEQYETIVGNLTAEPLLISSRLAGGALFLDLNREITFNFSLDDRSIVPRVNLDFHARSENITLADYSEPSDAVFLMLLLIGICAILILGFYLHYMVSGPLKPALFAQKKKAAALSRTAQFRGETLSRLKSVRRRIGKENPAKLYKETLIAMNSFITRAFRISGAQLEQADKKLDSYGITGSLKSDIMSYLTEYREAVYSASNIKDENVESLIMLAESILSRV